MEKFLIYIKHHLRFLWNIIEFGNEIVFTHYHGARLDKISENVISEFTGPQLIYRKLNISNAEALCKLINKQSPDDLKFFKPHGFGLHDIEKLARKKSFLMMGVFDADKLAGYFFLRFFANKKCFVGRLIDKNYRGKGIGRGMNVIMYEIAWRMDFRCLSTISRNNLSVMNAHANNKSMIVIKELANDFLLVEFVRAD